MIGWIRDEKGQVSIDYIVGMSIFIIAFTYLFYILIGLFIPFQSTSDEVKAMSDRISNVLVEGSDATNGTAIDAGSPNIINKTSLVNLNISLNNQTLYNNKQDALGLNITNKKYDMNVSLRYPNGSLYPSNSNPLLLGGPAPDEYTNVGETVRVIYLQQDSKRLFLDVKVWI